MKEFRQAAFAARMETLIKLYREGVNVNEPGPESQRTALHWGAYQGHLQVVSYLLKATKASIDPLDQDQNTPLNFLFQAKNLQPRKKGLIIDTLLSYGADPLQANQQARTPLMNLLSLRKELLSNHYYVIKQMDSLIQKMKQGVYIKAQQLNQTVTIFADGLVVFDQAAPSVVELKTHTPPSLERTAILCA